MKKINSTQTPEIDWETSYDIYVNKYNELRDEIPLLLCLNSLVFLLLGIDITLTIYLLNLL